MTPHIKEVTIRYHVLVGGTLNVASRCVLLSLAIPSGTVVLFKNNAIRIQNLLTPTIRPLVGLIMMVKTVMVDSEIIARVVRILHTKCAVEPISTSLRTSAGPLTSTCVPPLWRAYDLVKVVVLRGPNLLGIEGLPPWVKVSPTNYEIILLVDGASPWRASDWTTSPAD